MAIMETAHSVATNYTYVIPIAIILYGGVLYVQKCKLKCSKKEACVSYPFITRNALFVGFLVFLILYFNKPMEDLDESMYVTPAPF